MQILGFYKNKIYDLTSGKVVFVAKTFIQILISKDIYLDDDGILFKGNIAIKETHVDIIYYNYDYIVYENNNNLFLYDQHEETNVRIYNTEVSDATICNDSVYFLHDAKLKKYDISEKLITNVLELEVSHRKIFFNKNYLFIGKPGKNETEIFNLEGEPKIKTISKKVKKIIYNKYFVIVIANHKYLYDSETKKIIMELNGRIIESKEIYYYSDTKLNKLFLIKQNLEFVEIPFCKKPIDEHLFLNCIINPVLIKN